MERTRVVESLVRQVEEYAAGKFSDVARGAETPRLAGLLMQKYGRGVVDAAAIIFGSPRAADPISAAVDEATSALDPEWRVHDLERWAGTPSDICSKKTNHECEAHE
ncbi:hypothetical protein [Paracidovorax avenae]|uniref:hypothetical protein n=1 Tax=Paracidovorax avenae TaxID=80867 RepID=UPI000D20C047|nr:hypothetical protein [Paracidovorax avenae]AVT09667.1 hypothetical protein C8242_09375 [Paracidovorax avenae]